MQNSMNWYLIEPLKSSQQTLPSEEMITEILWGLYLDFGIAMTAFLFNGQGCCLNIKNPATCGTLDHY